MQRRVWQLCLGSVIAVSVRPSAFAQTAFTWTEIRAKLETVNPALQADQLGVDEFKATEITAFLRPNPQCALTYDQIGNTVSSQDNPVNIFSGSTLVGNCNYLHERQHKRE